MFRGFPSCKKNPRKLSVVDVRTGSYLAAKSAYVPWLMMSRQDRSGIPRGQILMMASHSLTHSLTYSVSEKDEMMCIEWLDV